MIKNEINKRIGHLNLAAEQTRILLLLLENREMCQNEIAERLGKDRPNVTRMITSLEKKGFVIRYKDRTNWKRKIVQLTALGELSAQELLKITSELNHDLAVDFTENELTLLYSLMDKLKQTVGK